MVKLIKNIICNKYVRDTSIGKAFDPYCIVVQEVKSFVVDLRSVDLVYMKSRGFFSWIDTDLCVLMVRNNYPSPVKPSSTGLIVFVIDTNCWANTLLQTTSRSSVWQTAFLIPITFRRETEVTDHHQKISLPLVGGGSEESEEGHHMLVPV